MPKRIRRQIRSRPAVCNVFDWSCVVEGDKLILRLQSDLPAKTRLQLYVERPSENYVWTDHEDPLRTYAMGEFSGFEWIRTIDELDRTALNKYRHWKGQMQDQIEGVPEDKLILKFYLYPGDHQFGVRNRDLTGSQVVMRKDGHWIERHAEVVAAIPTWLPGCLP